ECAVYKDINDPELSLFEAASYDNVTAARCLIKAGTNVSAVVAGGFTPIHASASRGNIEISRMLVNGGAKINVHDSIVAKLLLDSGANVNDKSKLNIVPLQVAAKKGFTDMSRLLLDKAATQFRHLLNNSPRKAVFFGSVKNVFHKFRDFKNIHLVSGLCITWHLTTRKIRVSRLSLCILKYLFGFLGRRLHILEVIRLHFLHFHLDLCP
ncbi:hypothetical protein L9F63_006092, partial [Diploptera punctata]